MRSPVSASSSSSCETWRELGDAHLAEVADLEVVALAGGFELLLLFVFGDGGATSASDGIPSAGTAVSGTVALVGAWSGHMGRGHLWERAGRLTMRPGSVGAERAARANRVAASKPVGTLGA